MENEFTADRWNAPYQYDPSVTIGQATLAHYDFRQHRIWVWLAVAYTTAWIIGLNVCTVLALAYLPRRPQLMHMHVIKISCMQSDCMPSNLCMVSMT